MTYITMDEFPVVQIPADDVLEEEEFGKPNFILKQSFELRENSAITFLFKKFKTTCVLINFRTTILRSYWNRHNTLHILRWHKCFSNYWQLISYLGGNNGSTNAYRHQYIHSEFGRCRCHHWTLLYTVSGEYIEHLITCMTICGSEAHLEIFRWCAQKMCSHFPFI